MMMSSNTWTWNYYRSAAAGGGGAGGGGDDILKRHQGTYFVFNLW